MNSQNDDAEKPASSYPQRTAAPDAAAITRGHVDIPDSITAEPANVGSGQTYSYTITLPSPATKDFDVTVTTQSQSVGTLPTGGKGTVALAPASAAAAKSPTTEKKHFTKGMKEKRFSAVAPTVPPGSTLSLVITATANGASKNTSVTVSG